MQLNERDIWLDVYTAGIHDPVVVTLIHLPTGCKVTKEGKSQTLLRKELMVELAKKVDPLKS